MRYFPILQELFESDSSIFLLVGFVFGMVMGLTMRKTRKLCIGLGISLSLYALCELAVNFGKSYMTEMTALFLGTGALGSFLGFSICVIRLLLAGRRADR